MQTDLRVKQPWTVYWTIIKGPVSGDLLFTSACSRSWPRSPPISPPARHSSSLRHALLPLSATISYRTRQMVPWRRKRRLEAVKRLNDHENQDSSTVLYVAFARFSLLLVMTDLQSTVVIYTYEAKMISCYSLLLKVLERSVQKELFVSVVIYLLMVRKKLICYQIGINYDKTPGLLTLKGCIHDAYNMKNFLISKLSRCPTLQASWCFHSRVPIQG